ncbi:MAG: hypothetical protein HN366_01050 [Deltaproteobacteria bacterium]|jgi:hypothetical protein|nr:hypothetical protein [Deltaproteobacteria bacterium]
MDYSVFNPTAWLAFIGFCILTWVMVKAFHARHPDYPGNQEREDEAS